MYFNLEDDGPIFNAYFIAGIIVLIIIFGVYISTREDHIIKNE